MNSPAKQLLSVLAPGKFYSKGRTKTHYMEWGDGQQPLLVLHKVTGGGETWLPMLSRLDSNFKIYAPDLLGHGYSSRSDHGYDLDSYTKQLIPFVQEHIGQPVILMGHSLGARAALALASAAPELIQSLVCIEPPLCGPGKEPYPYDLQSVIDWQKGVEEEGAEYCLRTNKSYTPEDAELRARYGILCAKELLPQTWDQFEKKSMDVFLRDIKCSTLLIRGENGVISQTQADEVAQINPSIKTVEIKKSGHNPPWDNNDDFIQAVENFLETTLAQV
ncbi:alpha/beta hydrolase [Puniceicoccaceae bacterium K14]|nr:alpha/beta hydrolase [Puniceicoccaceae bacterium K14]